MNMHAYLQQVSKAEIETLAAATGTKPIYLRQVGTGFRRPSIALALKLEHASSGLITARELRPDLPWSASPLIREDAIHH